MNRDRKRIRTGPEKGRGGDESFVDLPLDHDHEGKPMPAVQPRERRSARPAPPVHGPAGSGRRRSRGPLLWVLVGLALVAGAVAAWWLRPAPPLIRASSSLLDFGPQRLGSATEPLELRLANDGGRALSVEAATIGGDQAADFAVVEDRCSGVRLGSGEECLLAIGFEPGDEGPRRAVVEIAARAANAPLAVPLLGTGAAPRLAVSRSEVSFDVREIGSRSPPAAVTIENRGTASLEISSIEIEGAAASDFTAGGRCARRTLGPDESCAVTLVFTPRVAGERRASARVLTDAPGPAPLITLAGTGTLEAAALELSPERLDFGTVAVGGDPRSLRLTATNRGSAAVAISAVRPAEPDLGFRVSRDGCGGGTLEPERSCEVTVAFAPRSAGGAETPLRLELSGGRPGPWVRLSGTGEGVRLAVDPARLDFGRVRSGADAERELTIGNPVRVPLTLRRIAVEGADADDFRPSGACREGTELEPGASCSLTVRFAPTARGERFARLVVEPAAAGRVEVQLAGESVEPPPPPTPRARIEPATLEFGEQATGGRSGILDATLVNSGNGRLHLSGSAIEGEHAGDFQLVPGSCGAFLAPGGDCSIGVRFTPTAPGRRRARLVVRHDGPGGRSEVRLEGNATP